MGTTTSQTQNSNIVDFRTLKSLEKIIFDLNEDNINESVELTIGFYDDEFPYSFNLVICRLVYSCFVSKRQNEELYFTYLKMLGTKEEEEIKNPNIHKIIDIFSRLLISTETQESNYLLEKLIEQGLIESMSVKNKRTLYFLHYQSEVKCNKDLPFSNQFFENVEELQKENWKLHKKYVSEGVNPSNIAKVIRNDEVERLQEMSSQANFDFNQIIPPSLYERCSFVNNENVSLIDYSAFFGSIKCFQFLLLNGSKLENTFQYAVAGGNHEIIHLCEQNHLSFEGIYEVLIEFHRNEIFRYFYEDKIIEKKDLTQLGEQCIHFSNYELLEYLEQEGMKIDKSAVTRSMSVGNFFLLKHFHQDKNAPKNVLFELGNPELVKYFLK